MNTTELIDLLQRYERGRSGRSREISLTIKRNTGNEDDDLFIFEPFIKLSSTGEGICGAQICLEVEI